MLGFERKRAVIETPNVIKCVSKYNCKRMTSLPFAKTRAWMIVETDYETTKYICPDCLERGLKELPPDSYVHCGGHADGVTLHVVAEKLGLQEGDLMLFPGTDHYYLKAQPWEKPFY